jgi:hypothetical protein
VWLDDWKNVYPVCHSCCIRIFEDFSAEPVQYHTKKESIGHFNRAMTVFDGHRKKKNAENAALIAAYTRAGADCSLLIESFLRVADRTISDGSEYLS